MIDYPVTTLVRSSPSGALPGHGGAGGPERLARLDDPGGHALLGGLAPGPGVVGLLVADLAIDLEDAIVVPEHVLDDGPRERVLGVGVDVHLDHAVVDGRPDLLQGRAGAAVEDQVERLLL